MEHPDNTIRNRITPGTIPLENDTSRLGLPEDQIEEEKKINKKIVGFIVALIVLFIGAGGFFAFQFLSKKGKVETPREVLKGNEVLSENEKYKIREDDVIVALGVGFKVVVKKDWNVSVVEKSKTHNFLMIHTEQGEKIEFEAFSRSFTDLESYLENPLIQLEDTRTENINNQEVIIQTGKEIFANSNYNVITGKWEGRETTLLVRVYSGDKDFAESLFKQIAQSVSYNDKTALNLKIVKQVYAQKDWIPPSLPQINYQLAEVMGDPFDDQITKQDPAYKDGFVKGYRFLAFKSQRLAAHAVENRSSNPSSFINSQVFDSNGMAISDEMNTHIEFKAPYTGEYFLLVYSFGQQEGIFNLRIDDHDQIGCCTFIKYPDGAELLKDPEQSSNVLVGRHEVGYIRQCPKPITIVGEDTIQYEVVPRDLDKTPYLKSWRVWALMSPDLYKPKEGYESGFIVAGDNPENTTYPELVITQINANRILITPENDLFPKDHQVFIQEWGDRFFTQDKLTPPDLPILKNILSDYEQEFISPAGKYDFDPIEPVYIDWVKEDGTEVELLAGLTQYRKEIIGSDREERLGELLERFKQYFLDKGYLVSEKNTFSGIPTSDAAAIYPKDVVGLARNQTVCKLVKSSVIRFSIYCASLTE